MLELNLELVVEDISEKIRLDIFLSNETGWTRSQVKYQIDNERVLVNGICRKAGFLIKNGDVIKISFTKEILEINAESEDIKLDIIYEDEDFAIINKPQGMVVHPAPGSYNHTLVNALLYYFDKLSKNGDSIRPGIVHRIDKDTSGLLVVAKNDKSHESLAKQIAEHSCFRHYLALVEGNIKEDNGRIETYISRSKQDRKMMAVSDDGKIAITNFFVKERFGDYSLVEFVLETGRTHQIRVHMAHIGHSLLGDTLYGTTSPLISRQALHCYTMRFIHPINKQEVVYKSNLPEDMYAIIKEAMSL